MGALFIPSAHGNSIRRRTCLKKGISNPLYMTTFLEEDKDGEENCSGLCLLLVLQTPVVATSSPNMTPLSCTWVTPTPMMKQCFSSFGVLRSHLGSLLSSQMSRPHPWEFWFRRSRWGLDVCVFNKLPRWFWCGPKFENHCLKIPIGIGTFKTPAWPLEVGRSYASIMSCANKDISHPPERKMACLEDPKVLLPEQRELVKDGTLRKNGVRGI